MESNNICLENVTSGQAVRALTSEARSKLVIQRTNKVPEWKLAKQKTLWYNTREKTIMTGDMEELDMVRSVRGLTSEIAERRIILSVSKKNKVIGINIRGGLEYGLGIYVSRVDQFGIADKRGVRPGDQIMDVNGVPFDNIMHHHAVDILRNQMPLIMTVRHVGRYPVYKELCAEYTWSDGNSQLPSIHLPYPDVDIRSMMDDEFTDTCIDGSEGSMRHHPSESGIDLISYHSQNPTEYQEKLYHNQYVNQNTEAFLPKPADLVYRKKYHWDGAQSDDELETSRRMESWVKGVDRGTVNPGYASDSELDGPISRLKERYSSETKDEFDTRVYSVPNKRGIKNGNVKDYGSRDEDRDSLCEEQTMSFFIGVGGDGADYKTELQRKSIKETTKHHAKTAEEMKLAQSSSLPDNPYIDVTSPGFIRSHTEHTTSSASPTEHYKKMGMTGMQEMEYIVEKAKYTDVNKVQLQLEAEKLDSEVIKNSFGQPVGTLSYPQVDEMHDEEGYNDRYMSEGKLVTSLYSPDLPEYIRDLEYRKSNLGLRELDALTNTPVTIGHDKDDGKSSTRRKKWKTVKERFMGSLRNKSPKLSSQLSYSGEIDKYSMTLLEDSAKIYLEEDEYHAVMRHIQNYHETRDLDWLIEVLLAILDRPEKILLLKDIRGVIFLSDQIRFDQKVNKYQEDAYEKMATKVHLPLNSDKNKQPKKILMTTEQGGESYFHVKSVEQADREMNKRKEVVNVLKDGNRKSYPPSKQKPVSDYCDPSNMKDYMFGDRDIVISELEVNPPRKLGGGKIMAYVSKNKNFLGMRVSGGADFEEQREVIVDWVEPGGAASDEGTIKTGLIILAVDDQDLSHATHVEAVAALKKSFSNKRNVTMKMLLKDPTYL